MNKSMSMSLSILHRNNIFDQDPQSDQGKNCFKPFLLFFVLEVSRYVIKNIQILNVGLKFIRQETNV
jgi:hypothetical protein